jgi:hypothetical protein
MLTGERVLHSDKGECISPPDEGWWAAVLADEETYNIVPKEPPGKSAGLSAAKMVDWDYHIESVWLQPWGCAG